MFAVKLLRNPSLKATLHDAVLVASRQPFSKCCCPLNEKWRLMSAVTLERFPTLTQEKNQMEQKFQQKLNEIEFENSLLSDHELRHKEDQKLAERLKQVDYEETETEAIMQTAKEMEDKWEAEEATFTPASRLTEDDKSNNLKSSNRQLDRKLTLLVKQKMGDKELWVMPQGALEEGESMRQSAERVLAEMCGRGVHAKFVSNAPCGYLKYPLPPAEREKDGTVGAKVFFYKAQLQSGSVSPNEDISDYVWVTKSELKNYVPKAYFRRVNQFVLEL